MLEHLSALCRWKAAGQRFALATLVAVEGSAPRDPGASMAIAQNGELRGSISGGCVEAAIVEEAQAVLAGERARIVEYGISDSQAQAVGLSCGGRLTVLIDAPAAAFLDDLAQALDSAAPLALALRTDGAGAGMRLAVFAERSFGSLGSAALDEALRAEIRAGTSRACSIRAFGENGEPHGHVRVFVERMAPKPQMYVFGAIDFARAMLHVGQFLGYEVTLCDARAAFATAERFPHAERIAVCWPDEFLRSAPIDEHTVIVAFTHDEKFDVPLLCAALRTRAAYVGIMGSRRTTARRLEQLREAGLREEELARLCAPVGLDIGARTPEETAIAIAAEIVARRNERSGGRLAGGSGALRGRSQTPV